MNAAAESLSIPDAPDTSIEVLVARRFVEVEFVPQNCVDLSRLLSNSMCVTLLFVEDDAAFAFRISKYLTTCMASAWMQVKPYKCCEVDGVFTLCDFEPEFNLAKGPLSGKAVDHPCLPLASIAKAGGARLQDTTYCYDIPALFENAVAVAWQRVADKIPKASQPCAPHTSARTCARIRPSRRCHQP